MFETIVTRLDMGEGISDVMNYLLQGKFDPVNELHVRFLEELQ